MTETLTDQCTCAEYASSDRCGCRSCADRARDPACCPHRLDGVLAGTANNSRRYDGMCDRCFQEARDIKDCGLHLDEHGEAA